MMREGVDPIAIALARVAAFFRPQHEHGLRIVGVAIIFRHRGRVFAFLIVADLEFQGAQTTDDEACFLLIRERAHQKNVIAGHIQFPLV